MIDSNNPEDNPARHFALHKPFGFISQFVTNHNKKRVLGELYPFPEGTMAIGRLDEDSEGLLLLTTEGMMSEYIRSRKTEKEYYAQLDGLVSNEALERLRKGVEIGVRNVKYQTMPCKANKIEPVPNFPPRSKKIRDDRHGPTSWVSVILKEGKLRQVRKMTAAVGFPTLRLIRIRIGDITLDSLPSGEVVELKNLSVPEEFRKIASLTKELQKGTAMVEEE